MCTILLAWRCVEGADVILAANRDEFMGRSSTHPGVLLDEPRIAGGRDVLSGGTWLAITATGRMVAVTNRYTTSIDPSKRSRGLLPVELLSLEDGETVSTAVRALDPSLYNPFNIMYVSRRCAVVGHNAGTERMRVVDLEPGLHVLTLHDVDDARAVKVQFLAQALASVRRSEGPHQALRDMERILPDHGDGGRSDLEATCVHGDGYGTVSASSAALLSSGKVIYRHAPGPPCQTEWIDCSSLLGCDQSGGPEGPAPSPPS